MLYFLLGPAGSTGSTRLCTGSTRGSTVVLLVLHSRQHFARQAICQLARCRLSRMAQCWKIHGPIHADTLRRHLGTGSATHRKDEVCMQSLRRWVGLWLATGALANGMPIACDTNAPGAFQPSTQTVDGKYFASENDLLSGASV